MTVLNLELPSEVSFERASVYVGEKSLSQNTQSAMRELLPKLIREANPRCVYEIFESFPEDLLCGEDIQKHLLGCQKVLMFTATLGSGVDKLIRLQNTENVFFGLCLDALASVLIEQTTEQFEEKLKSQFEQNGLFLTSSYAPGYGDYPLSYLPKIIKILDTSRKIGVSINQSCLLSPLKTITAVIGISDSKVFGFRAGCEHCSRKDICKLKKEGKTCVR